MAISELSRPCGLMERRVGFEVHNLLEYAPTGNAKPWGRLDQG